MRVGRQASAGLANSSSTPHNAPFHLLNGFACPVGPPLPAPRARRAGAGRGSVAASAAVLSKEPVPAIVTYTVQRGETLWDVAVQHGVSMRTIKELNKLAGREPALSEGQQLLVPASGVTTLPAPDGAPAVAPAEALGSTPARGLWVGSEHVRLATVADAKQLYLRQCDRANPHNTLLVLYAPWCPHCRDLEDELERLAEGVSHVPSVRIVAVNGDSTEGRVFAREVLGVAYYPSIVSFPAASRTFYKYKGRARDAEALLRFLNMTCCAREDAMWALRPAGARPQALLPGPGQVVLPLGLDRGPVLAAIGIAAVAAAVGWMVVARGGARGGVEAGVVAELDNSLGRMAALFVRALTTRVAIALGLASAPASDPVAAAPAPAPAAPVAEAQAAPAVAGTAAGGGGAVGAVGTGGAAPKGPASASPAVPASNGVVAASAPAAVQPAASGQLGPSHSPSHSSSLTVAPAATPPAVPAAPSAAPEPISFTPAPAAPALALGAAAAGVAAAATAAATGAEGAVAVAAPELTASAAAAAPAAAAPSKRELTAEERQRLTRLTDDELIALVNSDPDLDKVLSRLLGDK